MNIDYPKVSRTTDSSRTPCLARRAADLAAESLPQNISRYQAGEATALEVVDAHNTLTQACNALDDGELRYRVAVANLQTLTGKF